MRLPQVQYNTPVQSLGRYDETQPIRTAQATTDAIMRTTNALNKWIDAEDAANVAKNTAEFNQRAKSLANDLLRQEVINLDEYPEIDLGIDESQIENVVISGEDGQQKVIRTVPKHLALAPIYDYQMNQLREEFTKRPMTGKGREQFDLDISETINSANLTISNAQFKDWHDYMAQSFVTAHTNFIEQGDAAGAQAVADSALATGVWSIETHTEKTLSLQNDIAVYNTSLKMLSEDPDYLDQLSDDVLYQPHLRPDQKAQFADEADRKAYTLRERQRVERERIKQQDSETLFKDNVSWMLQNNKPLSDEQIESAIQSGLEKSEILSLVSFNNTYKSELKTGATLSDNETKNTLMAQAVALSFPDAGSMNERKATVLSAIQEAHKNGLLVSKDAWDLRQQVNDSIAEPFKDPELLFVIDDVIYPEITGGTREAIAFDSKSPFVINAARAVTALRQAYQKNPALNPMEWWNKNRLRYGGGVLEENTNTAQTIRYKAILDEFGYAHGKGMVDTQRLNSYLKEMRDDGELNMVEHIKINNMAWQHNNTMKQILNKME